MRWQGGIPLWLAKLFLSEPKFQDWTHVNVCQKLVGFYSKGLSERILPEKSPIWAIPQRLFVALSLVQILKRSAPQLTLELEAKSFVEFHWFAVLAITDRADSNHRLRKSIEWSVVFEHYLLWLRSVLSSHNIERTWEWPVQWYSAGLPHSGFPLFCSILRFDSVCYRSLPLFLTYGPLAKICE